MRPIVHANETAVPARYTLLCDYRHGIPVTWFSAKRSDYDRRVCGQCIIYLTTRVCISAKRTPVTPSRAAADIAPRRREYVYNVVFILL